MIVRLLTENRRVKNVSAFNEGLRKVVLRVYMALETKEQEEILKGRDAHEYIYNELQIPKNTIDALYNTYQRKGSVYGFEKGLDKEQFILELSKTNRLPGELTINDEVFKEPIREYVKEFIEYNGDIVRIINDNQIQVS